MVRAAVLLACCCALPASAQQAQTLDNAQLAAKFAATASAAPEVPFFPPTEADEWYTVTIANVSVGYMHTTVATMADRVQTMEVMDVQVSRGVDTSRMAFETIFEETLLQVAAPELVGGSELSERTGGVKIMAYDQRFANSEVKMNASIDEQKGVTLVSYNGEKAHTSDLDLPEEAWLGRMRARLAFTKRCRLGETKITVQTMRPELGPRVVNLTSTLVDIYPVWDGTAMVDASVWSVQISGVPVNMSEAYPLEGPLRCYRMLHMALDMPFGYLLASIDTQTNALIAAEDDPNRKLPELVYTMFVTMSSPIPDVYEARMVQLAVRVKGDKKPESFELPSGGFQRVVPIDEDKNQLHVTIDLQDPQKATAAELVDPEYRAPSAMVDSSDEVVIELSHQVDAALRKEGFRLPKGKDKDLPPRTQLALTYALRDLVHSHISSKHLSTAYASASETVRTGSGDCTEHAVLLAALLKARSIPARVCHGLVYVEQGGSAISGMSEGGGAEANADSDDLGERVVRTEVKADGSAAAGKNAGGNAADAAAAEVPHPATDAVAAANAEKARKANPEARGQFGWHMWSQAMVNGRWIDLDATLHVSFSVGHVLVGTSSMSDKEAHNNHMQMAALIGNLEIDLLGFSHEWKQQ